MHEWQRGQSHQAKSPGSCQPNCPLQHNWCRYMRTPAPWPVLSYSPPLRTPKVGTIHPTLNCYNLQHTLVPFGDCDLTCPLCPAVSASLAAEQRPIRNRTLRVSCMSSNDPDSLPSGLVLVCLFVCLFCAGYALHLEHSFSPLLLGQLLLTLAQVAHLPKSHLHPSSKAKPRFGLPQGPGFPMTSL